MAKTVIALTFLLALMAGVGAAASFVYVTLPKAKILFEPKEGAKTVAIAKRGEELVAVEVKGDYFLVRNAAGLKGYVHKSQVSSKKPGTDDGLDQLVGLLGGGQRQAAAREGTSGHSIRGFKADVKTGASGVTDRQAEEYVERMESLTISGGELATFEKDGDVGAYAH